MKALDRHQLNLSMFSKLLSNRTLLSVSGELHIALAIAWVVEGLVGPFWSRSQLCNPLSVLESSFGDKRCSAEALSPLLFCNLDCIHMCMHCRKFLLY